jgi:hypothetical protein
MKQSHGNGNQNRTDTDYSMRPAPGGWAQQPYYSGQSLHHLPNPPQPAQQVYCPPYQPHPTQQVNYPPYHPHHAVAHPPMPLVHSKASESSQATRLACEAVRTFTELTLSNTRNIDGIYGKELINRILRESCLNGFSWKWKPAPVIIPKDGSNRRFVCWSLYIAEDFSSETTRSLLALKLNNFLKTFDSIFKFASDPSSYQADNTEIVLPQPCTHSVSVRIPFKIWTKLTSSANSERSHQIRKNVRNDPRLFNLQIASTPSQKQEIVELETQKRLVNSSQYCYHFETPLDALCSNEAFVSVFSNAVVKGSDILFTFYHHNTQLLENFYDQLDMLTWVFNNKEDGDFSLSTYNKYGAFNDALKKLDPKTIKLPLEKGDPAPLQNNDGFVHSNQYAPLLSEQTRKNIEQRNQQEQQKTAPHQLAAQATRPPHMLPPHAAEIAVPPSSNIVSTRPYTPSDFFLEANPLLSDEDDEQAELRKIEALLKEITLVPR